MSLLTLNILVSGITNNDLPGGGWGNVASGGLVDFGAFDFHYKGAHGQTENLWSCFLHRPFTSILPKGVGNCHIPLPCDPMPRSS